VPCLICGWSSKELRRVHDFGEARFVVGAEQRGAVRRDDVMADLVQQRRWSATRMIWVGSAGSTMSPPR